MMGLWADGWFYISSAGLLVSGILFFFLLGQYRVASEAADVTEGEQGADKEIGAPAVIRPVYIPDEGRAPELVSHPLREPESKPKPAGEFAGADRRKDPANTTGGISPAVVYLQNIKGELADLHKDLRALAKRVDDELASVSARDEALIDRLGELARAVDGLKSAAPVSSQPPAPAPAPKKSRKAEIAPEPAPAIEVVLESPASAQPQPVIETMTQPLPEPKAEPARSPDETIRMELGALVAQPPAQPEPAAAPIAEPAGQSQAASAVSEPSSPESPPEEKPRRGPVWPV